ncbi:MAG: terminase large subunit [Oscillospiraceae bacterium]|nr:terminase large subunit [Oscillospiraceae bacterium]
MHDNYIFEYHAKLKSGEITAGKWIKKVYAHLAKNIKSGQYLFNANFANASIQFIETMCHHSQGRNDLLKLELWQKAMISAIFGIVDADGLRVFREIIVIIGKKNGKSLLAAAILALMTFFDGEYGAQSFCVAPKLEQTDAVYKCFHEMTKSSETLQSYSLKRRSDIYVPSLNSYVKPLAFNYKKADGFNPHCVVNDELGAWIGDGGIKQYKALKSGSGARKQPLIFNITTAGYANDGIYDDLVLRSTRFLKGGSNEVRLLPFLYMIDDEKKWNDIDELKKANPNMGVSVPESYFREEMAVAEISPAMMSEYLTKYCNIKQNSSVAWLTTGAIQKAWKLGAGKKLEDFKGCSAVGGLDLSKTTALTSSAAQIERKGKIYSFTQFFMPEDKVAILQEVDGVRYDKYIREGILTVSGKSQVNYKDVLNWFLWLRDEYKIYFPKIGYDRYSAGYLVNDLISAGFDVDDVIQGTNLMPVIDEFEGIINDGKFAIVDNDLLAIHFLNTAMKQDGLTRRFRPVQIAQRAKIDGFVSNICAMTVRQKHYEEIKYYLSNE